MHTKLVSIVVIIYYNRKSKEVMNDIPTIYRRDQKISM